MAALRRILYLQAAVWAAAGLALAVAPRFVLVTLFDQPRQQEFAWLRLLGIQSVGLAMLMVLVAQRLEELWWWSWAFALVSVGLAVTVLLNAAFGLEPGQSGVVWWVFSVVGAALAFSLLYGLWASSREQPFP